MIHIKTSNICTVTGCPDKVLSVCKRTLSIPNPAFMKIARITGSMFAAQREFKYYSLSKQDKTAIQFPRGFAERFIDYLDKVGEEYSVDTDFCDASTAYFRCWDPVKLRDYQIPLVEKAVQSPQGVIYGGTGVGKTVMACEIVRQKGLRSTIVCPTTIIAKQFINEFKKWFGYDCGYCGEGQKTIKEVTVAMWQTLSSDPELVVQLADKTGLMIIDECQGITSKERGNILKKFRPKVLLGLSGTPRRSKDDGKTAAIFFLLGPVIAEHKMTQVVPSVEVINTRENIPVNINYAIMIDNMIANYSRNTCIIGLAVGEAGSGHKVLILCKRRAHCALIMERLEGLNAYYADSDDPDRNEVLMAMRNGERDFSILVGTVNILATGTDIPSLDVMIMAGDVKSDVLLEQGSGRILRAFEGKETAKIYDLIDIPNPILKKQGYERIKFYKNQGWQLHLPWESK